MRKLVFSIGALAIAFTAAFTWSQTTTPSQAGVSGSIHPIEMMANYKGTLPVEQWDAF